MKKNLRGYPKLKVKSSKTPNFQQIHYPPKPEKRPKKKKPVNYSNIETCALRKLICMCVSKACVLLLCAQNAIQPHLVTITVSPWSD